MSCALAAAVTLVAPHALAQSTTALNTRLFQPSLDPEGGVYLEPALTPGPGRFNGATWARYAFRPVTLRTPDGTAFARPFDTQVSSDVVANIGIGSRIALGVDVPFVIYQNADPSAPGTAPAPGASIGRWPAASRAGLGDIALVGKLNLVGYDELGGFGLALIGRQTAPTGDDRSLISDGSPTSELRLLAEYKILALSVQATGGFTLRTAERTLGNQTFGDAIPWGLRLALRPQALGLDQQGHWTWALEVHGAAMLPPSSDARAHGNETPTWPVLADLSARYAFGALSIMAAAETSFTQAIGGAPFAFMAALSWAPRTPDIDNDGVPDDTDQCPELPEDRDGVQDDDGCPDFDGNGQ